MKSEISIVERSSARHKTTRMSSLWAAVLLAGFVLPLTPTFADTPGTANPESILKRADVFPIGVWVQPPRNAGAYKQAGINFYLGLWEGPTEEHLAELKKHGMPVVCEQNGVGLQHRDDSIIIGWMHGDEPDNAQPKAAGGEGWDPPIAPSVIVSNYERIKKADPKRPVILNLGKGVAQEGWIGRGTRTGKLEDYPDYLRGCDIASFDIYPIADADNELQGKLWYVPRGVERLVKWTEGKKPVWNVIEASRIFSGTVATPDQIRAMVWMSIIHGSRGIVYFVHQWKPTVDESALLNDPVTLKAVTAINRQVQELAPVINSPVIPDAVAVQVDHPDVPIAVSCHMHDGALYLFACNLREKETKVTFALAKRFPAEKVAELNDAQPRLLEANKLVDSLPGYGVGLYRVGLSPRTVGETHLRHERSRNADRRLLPRISNL